MNMVYIRRVKAEKPTLLAILDGSDPRPDLSEDSSLWTELLRVANGDAHEIESVYGTLDGLRAWEARIDRRDAQYRLDAGEIPPGDYAVVRLRYLAPLTERLRSLMASLDQR